MKWHDIDFDALEIHLSRAIVDHVVGNLKTEASGKPSRWTLHSRASDDWRGRSPYRHDEDWVFASPRKLGRQPYWPDSSLEGSQARGEACSDLQAHRLAFVPAFVRHTTKGFVSHGQSQAGKLRHASSRITMDLYAQPIPADRRAA